MFYGALCCVCVRVGYVWFLWFDEGFVRGIVCCMRRSGLVVSVVCKTEFQGICCSAKEYMPSVLHRKGIVQS